MLSIKELKSRMIAEGIKTRYVKKSECNLWGCNIPNAGPRPNISGMRAKYWGKNALIAIQGQYAYKIN